jgi:hypothetical protein
VAALRLCAPFQRQEAGDVLTSSQPQHGVARDSFSTVPLVFGCFLVLVVLEFELREPCAC